MKQFHVPLFTKLINEDPHHLSEREDAKYLNFEDYESSIRAEIELILNARQVDRAGPELTFMADEIPAYLPEQFGLKPLTVFDLDSEQSIRTLCYHIAETLSRFEPRLQGPRVHVLPRKPHDHHLDLQIEGQILFNRDRIPVSFQHRLQFSQRDF